jgi:hypothetical protein
MNDQQKKEETEISFARLLALFVLWLTILYKRICFFSQHKIYYPLKRKYQLRKARNLDKNRYTGPVEHVERTTTCGGIRFNVPMRRIPGFTHVF